MILFALAALAALALAAEPALDVAVLRQLGARDGFDCATVPVDSAADLARYTAPELRPPAVAVRAASCLVRRFPGEAEAIVTPWAADPLRAGLVLAVVDASDHLAPDVAARFAAAALAGADPRARPRLERRLEARGLTRPSGAPEGPPTEASGRD
jgi:hypothetical protein